MRTYNDTISLTKNARGIYSLDTILGCTSGTKESKNGCYNDCYAARISKAYGYDFTKSVERKFKSESHKQQIINEIEKIPLPFVRIGTMGDPSENWEHTIDVCKQIQQQRQLKIFTNSFKQIVIITKHWVTLTYQQLQEIKQFNICINTSVSALDLNYKSMVEQYERIKPYCKSILRVVSCDFNLNNPQGHEYHKVQQELFKHTGIIDTVFRPTKSNKLVTDGVINVRKEVFNGKKQLASKLNRKTYMGKCSTCKEMCGVNV